MRHELVRLWYDKQACFFLLCFVLLFFFKPANNHEYRRQLNNYDYLIRKCRTPNCASGTRISIVWTVICYTLLLINDRPVQYFDG